MEVAGFEVFAVEVDEFDAGLVEVDGGFIGGHGVAELVECCADGVAAIFGDLLFDLFELFGDVEELFWGEGDGWGGGGVLGVEEGGDEGEDGEKSFHVERVSFC